jgi:hypothetical protein
MPCWMQHLMRCCPTDTGIQSDQVLQMHAEGLARLAADIANGEWARRNQAILDLDSLDAGYRVVIANTRNSHSLEP